MLKLLATYFLTISLLSCSPVSPDKQVKLAGNIHHLTYKPVNPTTSIKPRRNQKDTEVGVYHPVYRDVGEDKPTPQVWIKGLDSL
jgi:hypothetical protein